MLHKWRDKIKSLFSGGPSEDAEETEPTPSEPEQEPTHVSAKMIYQYPKNSSFKFPVIKDDKKEEKRVDVSAFKRKERMVENRNEEENKEEVKPERPLIKNEGYQKFTPSRVPSPIYGYHKREADDEVEETPTFMRKEESESNDAPVNSTKMENIIDLEAESIVADKQDLISKKKEIKHDRQKEITEVKPERTEKLAAPLTEITELIEKPKAIKETSMKDDVSEETHTSRREKREQQKKEQNTPQTGSPFNVLMTPRDRKNLMDKKQAEKATVDSNIVEIQETIENYNVPYHLLNDPVESSNEDQLWVKSQQELLERTLMHFNVEAKVVNATQGPSVTRFEVQPEFGVKVSKVRNLSDDIKLNMSAKDIRIEAPIPGKNTIGIEIPNKESQIVGLQEIFQTDAFQSSQSPLTIGLGLTVEGKALITNISKMPHGLIAGATGSGKSVCINTILISLIYKSSHKDVKFLLIDPKMVELAPYNGIPHLVAPVITDIKAATAALKWAVQEMEGRYEKFVKEGVRDIERYNNKMINDGRTEEKMPFMVIVIDELADLMMMAPQDVEEAICRIAQKARACGMHLLLATQRPSVDVITGLIKANIPTRIAFSVSSQVDSRTIIDSNGADRLLGKGDMLFIENGSGKNIRLQGAFVSDEEIERVTNYARNIAPPNYLFEQEELLTQIETDEDEDELFNDVLDFVLEQGSASTSLVQRNFRIGYNRAARLIDSLENRGIISGQNGSKPRDVLLTKSQVEEVL